MYIVTHSLWTATKFIITHFIYVLFVFAVSRNITKKSSPCSLLIYRNVHIDNFWVLLFDSHTNVNTTTIHTHTPSNPKTQHSCCWAFKRCNRIRNALYAMFENIWQRKPFFNCYHRFDRLITYWNSNTVNCVSCITRKMLEYELLITSEVNANREKLHCRVKNMALNGAQVDSVYLTVFSIMIYNFPTQCTINSTIISKHLFLACSNWNFPYFFSVIRMIWPYGRDWLHWAGGRLGHTAETAIVWTGT